MTEALGWVVFAAGGVVGFYVGRFRAEWGRARADGKAAMDRRSAYRKQ